MANIKPYTDQIAKAVYGEEVRSSIINALNKVNDDNDSYQNIKNEIVQAKNNVDNQVATFDSNVETAKKATTDLNTAITNANKAKTDAETAITNTNKAITNLGNVKTNLDASIISATTAKSQLDTTISNANTVISNANTTISDANNAKSQLDTTISNANNAKSQLETSINTGNVAKSNLDTAISSAGTSKSQLEAVITNSDTIKGQLSGVITKASDVKESLDASAATANTSCQTLSNENASAKSNLAELRSENFNSREILAGVANLEAYLGITDGVIGLEVDYENKTFKRLAGAVGKSAGSDFDGWKMYGNRKKCNVADDGKILAYYGDAGFKEDGSNGQVMVYQPKFYYLVAPINYDKQETGIGYHLRKANYYISEKPRVGFRLHPAFYDENGKEIDYVLVGAYEACIFNKSKNQYIIDDERVESFNDSLLSSISDVQPASGDEQDLTRQNTEKLAQNRGKNWHNLNIKITSMEQLLMMIELGTMNFQTAIGQGVVSIADEQHNIPLLTGSTSSLGNCTGRASQSTKQYIYYDGTPEPILKKVTETADGKTSICYRGVENDWGNMEKFVNGVNIWGNGKMNGGEPYICNDFNYAESKKDGNYEGAGFTLANADGFINAMGYSSRYDWLFMASEIGGNSALPVGDYQIVFPNLNEYTLVTFGGSWYFDYGVNAGAGGFCWNLSHRGHLNSKTYGGRLVYVPHASATD